MKDARVSFILAAWISTEFDETYERKTGVDGLRALRRRRKLVLVAASGGTRAEGRWV
jgi:hypothetical protein